MNVQQTPLVWPVCYFSHEALYWERHSCHFGCVILEGGGNAELRTWKAFGQWANTIRKANPKPVTPRTCVVRCQKIVIFIQGGDTLSKKVMEDLRPEERKSVVDEVSSIVPLSFET